MASSRLRQSLPFLVLFASTSLSAALAQSPPFGPGSGPSGSGMPRTPGAPVAPGGPAMPTGPAMPRTPGGPTTIPKPLAPNGAPGMDFYHEGVCSKCNNKLTWTTTPPNKCPTCGTRFDYVENVDGTKTTTTSGAARNAGRTFGAIAVVVLLMGWGVYKLIQYTSASKKPVKRKKRKPRPRDDDDEDDDDER